MRTQLWVSIIFYVLTQMGSIVGKEQYGGMKKKTVIALLEERRKDNPTMTYQFVTKQQFDAVVDKTKR